MKTMICLILDRSGSMIGREKDVIGGVNKFIKEQQKLPDSACMAFVRFDSPEGPERFRLMQDLKDVKPLTAEDFVPRGGTPLLDAIGHTINALENDWRTEKPDRAICIVVTDGQENSSREFSKAQIKSMISARQNSGLWGFIYLGANVDAFAEASSMGYSTLNTAGYANTTRGTETMYSTVSATVSKMRMSGSTFADVGDLGKNIEEDDEIPVVPTPTVAASQSWVPPTETSTPTTSPGNWTPPV